MRGSQGRLGLVERKVKHDNDNQRLGSAPVAPPPGDTMSEANNNDNDDKGTAIFDVDANEAIPDDVPAAEEEETSESKDELEDKIVPADKLARLIKAGQYDEAMAHHKDRERQKKE